MERDIDKMSRGVADLMSAEGANSDQVHKLLNHAIRAAMESVQVQADLSGVAGTASFRRWWIQCDQIVRRDVVGEQKEEDYPDHHDMEVMPREPINAGPGGRTPIRVGGCTLIPGTSCYLCYEIAINS